MESSSTMQSPDFVTDESESISTSITDHNVHGSRINRNKGNKRIRAGRERMKRLRGEREKMERTAITCLRYSFALLMIVVTVTGALVTWSYREQAEQDNFEYEFDIIADDIEILSEERTRKLLTDYESLSLTISGLAHNSGSQWPFFTDPSFPMIANSVMEKTRTHIVSFSPIVHNLTESRRWAMYSQLNQDWIKEGIEVKKMLEMGEMVDDPHQHHNHRSLQGHDHHNHNNHDHHDEPNTPTQTPTQDHDSQHNHHDGHDNIHEPNDGMPKIFPAIFRLDPEGEKVLDLSDGPYLPSWQMVDAPEDPSVINYNLLSDDHYTNAFEAVMERKGPVLTDLLGYALKEWNSLLDHSQHSQHDSSPFSMFLFPVFENVSSEEIVAILTSDVDWLRLFPLARSEKEKPPVHVVVDEGCQRQFTFAVSGATAEFVGYEDAHHSEFDKYARSFPFSADLPSIHLAGADCSYTIHVYPTREFWTTYHTQSPLYMALTVAGVCLVLAFMLLGYDVAIHMRQRRIARDASRSEEIISVLYPKNVRDRLFRHEKDNALSNRSNHGSTTAAKYQLKHFLGSSLTTSGKLTDFDASKPIADLFMDATVMFADIAGFTAWSSVREPTQVFTLLESVYGAFDIIAKRRKVFKVETIGDCYVAVTGLPEPTKDHASIMAFFAREIVAKFKDLVGTLEARLGPDTSNLALRVGMHSGPVTAGVLRGEKARFQLFGDTVNTASRIESSSKRNSIHISEETADLLARAGKSHLLEQRNETVEAKGKGKLQTYWLMTVEQEREKGQNVRRVSAKRVQELGDKALRRTSSMKRNSLFKNRRSSARSSLKESNGSYAHIQQMLPPKMRRLCAWNAEILIQHLKKIVAHRNASRNRDAACKRSLTKQEEDCNIQHSILDEVVEIIPLPGFDPEAYHRRQDPSEVELPTAVIEQVRMYVACIASQYHENPFHNFDHASHVTMSVSKLLSRIVAADDILNTDEHAAKSDDFGWNIHDHTYGITSDPMTQFTVILAALVHDVDHMGVSNAQLIKEGHELADLFKNKSVAEQNSIAVAWDLLMDPRFLDFRRTIYTDEFELSRFRQLIANTVLATDIMDKELQSLRRGRWDRAFSSVGMEDTSNAKDNVNRKATIVIEHLIQASDVSHTMQHWHMYCKWNERLFSEMAEAYKEGRLGFNPAEKWYEGEIGFYDNYVIPLAKKLKDCGVFGVASDEYLIYAQENRREWEEKGQAVVRELEMRYLSPTGEYDVQSLDSSRRLLRRGSNDSMDLL